MPSDQDKKIAGILRFTNTEGIQLQLVGSFQNFGQSFGMMGQTNTDIPIILGIVDLNIIALCNCIKANSGISCPGFTSERYWAQFALIGRHFTQPDELLFNKIRVQYNYLSDWTNLPVIQEEPELPYQDREQKLRFIYTRPKKIQATTTDGKFFVSHDYSKANFVNIDFKQFASLIIEPNEKLYFQDFYSKFIHPFNNFITFATAQTNCVNKLEFYSPYGNVDIKNCSHSLDEIPIKCLYKNQYPHRKNKIDYLLNQKCSSPFMILRVSFP